MYPMSIVRIHSSKKSPCQFTSATSQRIRVFPKPTCQHNGGFLCFLACSEDLAWDFLINQAFWGENVGFG